MELSAQPPYRVVTTHRTIALGTSFLVGLVLAMLLLGSAPAVLAVPPAAPAASAAAGPAASATAATAAAAAPAAAIFNPVCQPIVPGVCVSVQSATEPAIVPPLGSYSATVEPSANQSLPLVVKSQSPLNQSGTASPRSGPDAPVILNVTANLWNGNPYYSMYAGTTYHSTTAQWWDGPLATSNTTYPWWYLVNLSATSPSGQPNFFPGMTVTWSIEITYNVSGTFIHEGSPQSDPAGPAFHFTYASAWPYSPDAGAGQYDGAAAYAQDMTTTRVPAQPNWNDSVTLTLNSTPQDVANGVGIGQAYVDLTETSANGTFLGATTFSYGTTATAGTEVPKIHFTVPPSWAQQAGATVRYSIAVADAWGDWIDSGPQTYHVGGNGSFVVGQFGDDLALTSYPSVTLPVAPLAPGSPVGLLLTSQNSGTAIASATVFYSVDLPQLNEVTTASLRMARINSTAFDGTLPGFPVGAGVNFTVEAWDFSSVGETSPNYNYSMAPVATALPTIAANGTFFYVGVRNGGNDAWINGATVRIAGPGGYFRSVGTTFAGLAYPNGTSTPYSPIVVPAGQTYLINVTDPAYHAAGVALTNGLEVNVSATHAMGAHEVLLAGPTYTVYQDGDLIVFWFNATAPALPAAPSDLTPVLIGSIAGLAAAALVTIPLLGWWKRIEKRRQDETKRVTL
jgi:hypothetical protein